MPQHSGKPPAGAVKPGLAPGELVHIGEKRVEKALVSVIEYDAENFSEVKAGPELECPSPGRETTLWINVDGLHDTELLQKTGKRFSIHPLVLEDICNTGQRPKMEDYGDYLYIVMKMATWNTETRQVDFEQVSLVLTENCVISFQERPGDVFEPVRQRLRLGKGRIKKHGADFLAYSLLDAAVDEYFVLLEQIGDQVAALEDDLLDDPGNHIVAGIHELKREMIYLRKTAWPLREVVALLERSDGLVTADTALYARDLYDHVIQVIDGIETLRDVISGMLDVYLSSVSNRMNEIMKVLTIIATIFIPLTFLAGVYGMNFRYMPELQWKWAYPVVWLVMLGVAGWMVRFFRRRGWL
ncbi:MAG: magnesium/cobalt transporter CorA [Synergistota bacterium]|nr:magnesium/cobalt transporter CorA [Synergistota bacterium]